MKCGVIAISSVANDKDFLKYAKNFNPITLRERVTTYTKYKAFKNNILITYVSMNNKTNRCYKCGSIMKRNIKSKTNKKIKEEKAICENGHQADYFFNSAMNIAINCIRKYKN